VRNRARSVGALTGDVVSQRSRVLFMIVIFLLLLMVNAVFAVIMASEFMTTPSSVIPVWSAIAVALVIGVLIYRMGVGILWPTVVGTMVLYAVIYLGEIVPITLPLQVLGLGPAAQWILILFAYAAIASMLPVWLLLQPRDYINGIQLFIGLGLMFGAVLIASPTIVAPAWNSDVPAGAPPIVPLLFVTVACGAISGFHGLVGSGTTSKQLNKETDARFVGYLGSMGEGALALVSIIAATAGFASLADWQAMYSSFGQGGLTAFVQGGATILNNGFGLPVPFSRTLLTVMAILFAGTTMDAGVRLQRYIIQEWGVIYRIPALNNGYVATLVAVAACLVLAFGAGGTEGTGGMVIWPLFGTSNQLLAGLTLLVISVMLVKLGRPAIYTLVPMVFVTGMAFLSAVYQLWNLYETAQYLLLVLDVLIIIAAVMVMLEAVSALMQARRSRLDTRVPAVAE
jgi:carbon starvation protein